MVRIVFLCLLLFASSASLAEEARVVFEGTPTYRTITSPETTERVRLDPKYALRKRLIITQRNGKYYWASRENGLLVRTESGSYITYIAADGTGYVRTSSPEMYALKKKLPPEAQVQEVDYMEHLVSMFDSIVFYGNKD